MAESVEESPSIRGRLPRDITRMSEGQPGVAAFCLRSGDHWREDLADALAIMTVAEEGDNVTLVVQSDSRRVMLEISLECARLERPKIVVTRGVTDAEGRPESE